MANRNLPVSQIILEIHFLQILRFFNSTGRSFINKLKNFVLKISPFLSPTDVLNIVET